MTPTPKDPVDALMALAKECGATVYAHRTSPHEPAVAFGPSAWEAFSARALAAVPAAEVPHEKNCATQLDRAWAGACDCGAIAQQAGGVPAVVSWQVRRTDGSLMAVWESCTKDLFDETKRTGRYGGYEGAPPCEVRELVVLAAAPSPSAVQPLSEAQIEEAARQDFNPDLDWSIESNFFHSAVQRAYFRRGFRAAEITYGIVTPKEPT